jgi:hypothetical protein
MSVKTEDLEPILDRIHEWIRSADVKTDILTATQAAVVGVLLPQINDLMAEPGTTFWYEAGFVVGVGLLITALARSVMALFPRVKKDPWWRRLLSGKREESTFKSITYFGSIASWKLSEYRERLNNISDEDLREDFITQIHSSATIAARKHGDVKKAIQFFCAGLVIISLAYLRLRGWF